MRAWLERLGLRNKPTVVRLLIECDDAESVNVGFEPWASFVDLPRGDRFDVQLTGPSGGLVEVVHRPGSITIFGWAGSTISAKDRAGKELLWSGGAGPAVPDMLATRIPNPHDRH